MKDIEHIGLTMPSRMLRELERYAAWYRVDVAQVFGASFELPLSALESGECSIVKIENDNVAIRFQHGIPWKKTQETP